MGSVIIKSAGNGWIIEHAHWAAGGPNGRLVVRTVSELFHALEDLFALYGYRFHEETAELPLPAVPDEL